MWITVNERGKIDSNKNIGTPRRDDNPMFWVNSEKAISVIFVFDLRKGEALKYMEKIFLDATANQHPLRYDAMNKSRSQEVLCKHNLLNFKVLKIDTNTASDYIEC